MDDDMILERGGTEEDIRQYALQNGADLTAEDITIEDLLNNPCCDSPGREKCLQCQELNKRD